MCILIVAAFFAVIGLAIFGPAIVSLLRHLRPLKRLRDSRQIRTGADRHRIRFAFTSIWTKALGLGLIAAVIFLVGASHVGFEIWRHYSGEGVSPSMARLEALLQKKLPDPDIQQRQHQELVDAIQNRRSPDTILVPADNEANKAEFAKLERFIANLAQAAKERSENMELLGSIAKWILGSLFAAGAFLLVRSFVATRTSRRALEIAAAGALAIPSLFGGFKLATDLKTDFTAIKDMGGFTWNIQWGASKPPTQPPDVNVYLHLDVGRGQDAFPLAMDCGEGDKQRVGPFDAGGVELIDAKKNGEAVNSGEDVAKELFARAGGNPERLTAIILIGSADKRSLKPQTVRSYSSNAGLAQARIDSVKKDLAKVFKPDKPPIMAVYAGPENASAKASVADLAKDRAVQVCVLWDRKPESR